MAITTHTATTTTEIPYGYCHCGCGGKAPIAKKTHTRTGSVRGEPLRFIRGHNPWRSGSARPRVSIRTCAEQIDLDNEIDAERIERVNWQRAIDADLRALKDYVHEHQAIIWHPGNGAGGKLAPNEVHLTSESSCTCSRFKLRGTCPHVAFLRKTTQQSIALTTNHPVHARDLEAHCEA